jgi:DNA-binding transcriptional regulator YbjK
MIAVAIRLFYRCRKKGVEVRDRTARIAALADAAIGLLAEEGARGLTHRAVDARAGMPPGTTSGYLRTRKALIEAVVDRLAELDGEPVPPAGAGDLDALAAGIAAMLDHQLGEGRTRSLARYACLLEATHQPELRTGAASRAGARALLEAAGAPDAQRRADHLVAFLDGLLFDRLVGAGALTAPPPGTAESLADLTQAVRLALVAATQ